MMANQLLLATGPQEKLAFIILLYVTANLLLLKEAHPSSSFRCTGLTVYTIGCWTFNLLSGFLVILKTKTATQISILPLLPHVIPFLLLFGISKLSERVDDSALIWFTALAAWRYFRLFVNLYSFWRYKPASLPTIRTIGPKDATMILPTVTVSESDNPDFEECLTTCLINKPAGVIIVTDTDFKAAEVNKQLLSIRDKIQGGSSSFLSGLGPTDISGVDVRITYAGVADKRCQMTHAIQYVQTRLTMFLDDHVFLPRLFLDSVVPVFENPCVGLCGTKKAVRRKHPEAHSLWGRYWELFWNVMGALYLARHNFEIRATNAMDGGVFVVSGRALVILTEIVQDDNFRKAFTNERFLFGLFGPLNPDDDNFITRWVLRHPQNYEIKIQYTDNATIETTLGQYPKFLAQCLRWARTTFRSNSCSLITDRTVWRRLPWTVWTTYIPSLFNLALFWDAGMLYALTKTNLYSESRNPMLFLLCFGGWIYLTKLVKLIPYFWRYPTDFFLFFFPIPAYPLFAYCHSILKLWASITFWNHSWTGRNLGASRAKPFSSPAKQQQPMQTLDENENW
jgi:hypothetical protein